MTRIRASCPQCGEVDLQPDDIELTIVGSNLEEVGDGSTYRFSCPDCTELVTKPADRRIARLLATGGVAVSLHDPDSDTSGVRSDLGHLQMLLRHPEQPALFLPQLTTDDLIDFHELLADDDWFDQVMVA